MTMQKIKTNRYLNGNCVCTQQECLIRLRGILLQCLTFQEYKVQNSSQERNWDMTTYIGYVMLTYIFVWEKQKFEVYNENSICFTKSSTNRHFLICVLLCFCWALGTWVKEKSHLPKTESWELPLSTYNCICNFMKKKSKEVNK